MKVKHWVFLVAAFSGGLCSVAAQAQTLNAQAETYTVKPASAPVLPVSNPPLRVLSESVESFGEDSLKLSGKVEMQRGDTYFSAPEIQYQGDVIDAEKDLLMQSKSSTLLGDQLHYNLKTEQGTLQSLKFFMPKKTLNGQAQSAHILNRNEMDLRQASMTSCRIDDPDWLLTGTEMHLDYVEDYAYIWGARLRFFNTTIFALPYLAVPISNQRHSGWLEPDVTFDASSGLTYRQPYYLNLAPNWDATLTPAYYALRGPMVSAQTRYLQPSMNGVLNVDWMPNDSTSGQTRYTLEFMHNGNIAPGLNYGVQELRVSDNSWWKDFPGVNPAFDSRVLGSYDFISYQHAYGQFTLDRQMYRVQQDNLNPVSVPYSREWRFYDNIGWSLNGNWKLSMPLEYASFSHPTQIQGQRFYSLPKISYSNQQTAYSTLFSVGVLHNQYQLRNGQRLSNSAALSVMGGKLFFERQTQVPIWGNVLQTLEPSLYYHYAPYRNQDDLPVFDTAVLPFNFDNLAADNSFSGFDRVADANSLTVAATTRFIEPGSSNEFANFSLGQRWHLRAQQVRIPGQASQEALSNIIGAAALNPSGRWRATTTFEYSPKARTSVNFNWALSYITDEMKTVQLARTYSIATPADVITLAWQWPISSRWYSAGRLGYSFVDSRLSDALLGFEYLQDCWAIRFGVDMFSISTTQSVKRYLLQLEFSGFSRVGVGPISRIKSLVPNYRMATPTLQPPDWVKDLPSPSSFE